MSYPPQNESISHLEVWKIMDSNGTWCGEMWSFPGGWAWRSTGLKEFCHDRGAKELSQTSYFSTCFEYIAGLMNSTLSEPMIFYAQLGFGAIFWAPQNVQRTRIFWVFMNWHQKSLWHWKSHTGTHRQHLYIVFKKIVYIYFNYWKKNMLWYW